jgi:hypothetical protein
MAKRLNLFIFLLWSLPSQTVAQHYCSEPDQPYCLTSFSTFEDEWAFESCRREMDDWADEVVRYGECLANWVEETAATARSEQSDAVSDYQDGVDYWNCKAQNANGYCSPP